MNEDQLRGPAWTRMVALQRYPCRDIHLKSVPQAPGVYAWFDSDEPVYAGKASGAGGLRDRLSKHLGLSIDLSRSSLRRNVAEHLLGIPTSVSRQRPSLVTPEQAAAINEWIGRLEVAWLISRTSAEAVAFERLLLGERMPFLSKR